ncbi:MAG: hypothetical protein U5L72_03235 [Bacteroidales bacterium]|nr:hypothetical protein [Bacteroidales bacterium]
MSDIRPAGEVIFAPHAVAREGVSLVNAEAELLRAAVQIDKVISQ